LLRRAQAEGRARLGSDAGLIAGAAQRMVQVIRA
jgi:hypothetical protein